MTRSHAHAAAAPQKAAARPVSRRGDVHEREADKAADVVGRGGTVAGWSFSAVPATGPAPAQRQEVVKEKTEDEKQKEALKKAGEAALATKEGQALKEKVLDDPLVKTVKEAVTSTPGIIATGVAAAGGVAALAATGKELPFQPPEIPLDKITPGLSAQVTYQGPVNAPTFVGLSITYKEQGPKGRKGKVDPIAAETARLKAENERFQKGVTYAPGSKEAEDQRMADEAVNAWILRGATLPGFTIPLKKDAPKKDEDKAPAQPAPASASAAPPAHARVDAALSSPGRPLERPVRRAMQARFGYDFSGVRVHDDAPAAAAASGIDAAAFTVGEHVVFGAGRSATGAEGRRLIAHELSHVVQQSPGGGGGRAGDVPSNGRPLDPELREYFERRLHRDLGGVKVHDDAEAAAAARERRARAYTVGSHVVFAHGQYRPETFRGRWLLGHELAHVAQASDGGAVDSIPAVERDASVAATAAMQGRPARVSARRDSGAVHLFGEPDNTPDLTFVSTAGTPGFLRQATAYHQTWGLAPQSFASMQALLATLAAGTGTINRLRIVSHANADNIFTPLFDGGAAGITEPDLLTWGESDVAGLRRTLGNPIVTGPLREQTITSAEAANPTAFAALGVDPANLPTTGPVAQLLDASVDLATIRGAQGLPAAQRTTLDTALTQELDTLRPQVVAQAPAATAVTDAQVLALQNAITGLIVVATLPAQNQQLMANITRATGAVANGFRANLTAVRGRLTSSSWVDIRGCRVGQQPSYLAAVSTFFGGPHVSGPDIWQSFPQLGWHTVAETGMTRKAAEANVVTALDHWADVTGIRSRLAWWLTFLHRVLTDEALRELQQIQPLLRPPSLLGGLNLPLDPLMVDFSTDLPPMPALQEPTFGAGVGYQPPPPSLGGGTQLQNPLVPIAQRDIARFGGADGLFRYYMDAGLPLPVQEGSIVELMALIFKVGREREAIDAWTTSEWGPAAPGLAAVQTGAWTRDAIRQVEAVVNLDAQRRATEMFISPDPLYAAHIKTT